MDSAKDKYDSQLVEDVKCLLRVLVLYIPLPIFWALYDQTGSRWTFQATRMNGMLGSSFKIKPDQMQVINPFLILFLLPLFDKIIYPAFAKCNMLVKPLQRMTAGGILTASSFFISGFLELEMMKTYAKIPAVGFSDLHFMNNIPCHVSIQLSNGGGLVHEETINDLENMVLHDLEPGKYSLDMEVSSTCLAAILTQRTAQVEIMAHDKEVTPVFLGVDGGAVVPTVLDVHDDPEKDDGASGRLRVVYDMGSFGKSTNLTLKSAYESVIFNIGSTGVSGSKYEKIDTGSYKVMMDDALIGNLTISQGGVYSLIVAKDPQTNIH
jgi:solute carrier family 15 oligopeptide transporter 1